MPSVKCATTFTVSIEKNTICCMKLFSLTSNGLLLNSPVLPGANLVSLSTFFLLLTRPIFLLSFLLNRLTLALLLNRLILTFSLNRLMLVLNVVHTKDIRMIGAYQNKRGYKNILPAYWR